MIDQSDIPPHVIGGIVYAMSLAQSVILALVNEGVIPAARLAEHLDVVALQWDLTAADPNHAIPDVLKNARARLGAFMKLVDQAGSDLKAGDAAKQQPTPHELHILAMLTRAERRGNKLQ